MNPVEALAALAGPWRGTSTLQDPHTRKPDVRPLLGETTHTRDHPGTEGHPEPDRLR
jgi:hypothetical protein